jgi:hypothetical protein
MRVKQGFVELDYHRPFFMEKYNVQEIKNKKEPAVFFSCAKEGMIKAMEHEGLGICIWVGRDVRKLATKPKLLQAVKEKTNLKHISTANFISPVFSSLGLPYKEIPLTVFKTDEINPHPRGNEVFAYIDTKNKEKFNTTMVEEVASKIPYKMHICNMKTYSRKELIDVYKKCFVGVKLAGHEGFANVVAEMGFMGRRFITRLNSPNAIYWYSVDDVIESINKEYDASLQNKEEYLSISQKMKNHLRYRDDFLYTEFWEK